MIHLIEVMTLVAMAPPDGGGGEGGLMGSFWFPLISIYLTLSTPVLV